MKVAITGGTGTLGRALIRRLLADGHERVVSISRDEVKAEALQKEFEDHPNLRVFLGDVRNAERLKQAFYDCEVVIHAAALKKVTAVYYPAEVIETNILGSQNTICAAAEAGVGRVLLVSSDKAVHATNLYGSTKFTAECYATQANSFTVPQGTRVACTRYGNVLGSRGSVLEVWADRVAQGLPLLVTDKAMTRFVIMREEAVEFILHALDRMQGGEIFIPQLPAMRLVDLAEAVAPGYPIEVTGLRPGGEKLHEQLISAEEESRLLRTRLESTLIVAPSFHPWTDSLFSGADYIPAFMEGYSSDKGPFLSVAELRDRCGRL